MEQAFEIHGTWHPAFGRAVDAFRENFTEHGEVGAGFCVRRGGEVVVDVWAGLADVTQARPWTADTMAVTFSTTKGLVALAFLMLEDRGEIDLDLPVTTWWPEFGAAGKAGITARTLLNHRAGLSALRAALRLEDFRHPGKVDDVLAAEAPAWEPGTAQGYGATAWGMYAGALFRRAAGMSVGAWLRQHVAAPLGADLWLGLPADLNRQVATLYPVPGKELARNLVPDILRGNLEGRVYRQLFVREAATRPALLNPRLGPAGLNALNEPWVRAIELPWMNGIASARALATVYSALADGGAVDGVRLVKPDAIDRVLRRQSWSWEDRVMQKPMGFAQGFMKEEPHLFSPNEATVGHPGVGGAFGWADPSEGLSFGYVPNRLHRAIRSPRALRLCHGIYRSLGYG